MKHPLLNLWKQKKPSQYYRNGLISFSIRTCLVVVSTSTVNVAMGQFAFGCLAHIHNTAFEVQVLSSQWVVEIHRHFIVLHLLYTATQWVAIVVFQGQVI